MCNVFAPSYSQKIFNQSITNQGMSVYLVAELFCQNAIFPLKVMEFPSLPLNLSGVFVTSSMKVMWPGEFPEVPLVRGALQVAQW